MQERLIGAPWWLLSLVMGAWFGVGMFVFGLTQDMSLVAAAVTGVIAGIFFGFVMGPLTRRANVRQQAALVDVTEDQRRLARRAAWSGPVPVDPDVRLASLALLDQQVASYRRLRWAIYMYAALLLISVALLVTGSRWHSLEVLIFGVLLFAQAWTPRHLARRRLRLVTGGSAPAE